MKLVLVDRFAFDAETQTKEQIEGLVQSQFDMMTKPGTMRFSYDRTAKGYKYVIHRYLPYAYLGFVIDVDCTFLTDIPIHDFQIDMLDSSHKPLLYAVPGSNTDGYYIPIKMFETFYKDLLGAGDNAEQPTKVKVTAYDTMVSVDVEY